MSKCPGVIDAAQDTIVVALELADKTILRSPEMIQKVLASDAVRKELEKVLQAEGERLTKLHTAGTKVSAEEAKEMGKKAATAVATTAVGQAQKQIEQSQDYKKLRSSLRQLECSFKKSPVGVFVDENKGWLILVGAGMALGGATAMYVIRDADVVGSQIASLANQLVRFKVLGNVEVGAKDIRFKPSDRDVEITGFATGTWKSVQAKFDLSVAFKDDKLTSTSARGEVVVKIAKDLKVEGHGQLQYKPPVQLYQPPFLYDIGLSLSYLGAGSGSSISITALAFATQTVQQRSSAAAEVSTCVWRAAPRKRTRPSRSV